MMATLTEATDAGEAWSEAWSERCGPAQEDLKIGDAAQLVTGGPLMTVKQIQFAETDAYEAARIVSHATRAGVTYDEAKRQLFGTLQKIVVCCWFSGDDLKEAVFPHGAVRRVGGVA